MIQRQPSPYDDDSIVWADYPDVGAWTDALALEGRIRGIYRQCSLGYHGQCSDPIGETCACTCHEDFNAIPRHITAEAAARLLSLAATPKEES